MTEEKKSDSKIWYLENSEESDAARKMENKEGILINKLRFQGVSAVVEKVCRDVSRNWILSVQFSRSVVSDSLRPQESQHARPPCPSPSP